MRNRAKSQSVRMTPSQIRLEQMSLLRKCRPEDNGVEVDWIKVIAVAGSTLYGVEKMLKVFKLWKIASNGAKSAVEGITIRNGEYRSMLATLGRIERRIDHVVARVDNIEARLST